MSQLPEFNILDGAHLADVMGRKYAPWLNGSGGSSVNGANENRHFVADVKFEAHSSHVTVSLRNKSGSFVYPVEGRIMTQAQSLSAVEGASIVVDFIDLYFEEYLKSEGDVFLPIDWTDYEMEGKNLQVRGQIINEQLEKLADDVLAGRPVDMSKAKGSKGENNLLN